MVVKASLATGSQKSIVTVAMGTVLIASILNWTDIVLLNRKLVILNYTIHKFFQQGKIVSEWKSETDFEPVFIIKLIATIERFYHNYHCQ